MTDTNKELKKEVRKDIAKYSALEAVSVSEGGKLILKGVTKEIEMTVNTLMNDYSSLSEAEIKALCARLGANWGILKVLTNSRKNKKFALDELQRLGPDEDEEETQ